MTSVTGDTSSFAAILGSRPLANEVAAAIIWEYLFWLCRANTRGVKLSGRNPLKWALSATRTLASPGSFEASEAT